MGNRGQKTLLLLGFIVYISRPPRMTVIGAHQLQDTPMFHLFPPGNASSAAAALAVVRTPVPTAGRSRGRVPRRHARGAGRRRRREAGHCDFLRSVGLENMCVF